VRRIVPGSERFVKDATTGAPPQGGATPETPRPGTEVTQRAFINRRKPALMLV
jgi:hypothetical protein